MLDKYFGSVCELDIIFNFEKAYFILDELILGGEMQVRDYRMWNTEYGKPNTEYGIRNMEYGLQRHFLMALPTQETSKKAVLSQIEQADKFQEVSSPPLCSSERSKGVISRRNMRPRYFLEKYTPQRGKSDIQLSFRRRLSSWRWRTLDWFEFLKRKNSHEPLLSVWINICQVLLFKLSTVEVIQCDQPNSRGKSLIVIPFLNLLWWLLHHDWSEHCFLDTL